MEQVFRLNSPQVACEDLAGDLILLHFGSGLYFNIQGTGADLCQFLMAGGTVENAVEQFSKHFQRPREVIGTEIASFVEELVREGILVLSQELVKDLLVQFTVKTYAPPRCEKFDDMADQLLLDKIDEPNREPGITSGS